MKLGFFLSLILHARVSLSLLIVGPEVYSLSTFVALEVYSLSSFVAFTALNRLPLTRLLLPTTRCMDS
jgi:hypothetical protein